MAAAKSPCPDIKTQFCTKEGCYKLLQLSDYSRPLRPSSGPPNNIPVRFSFVTLKDGTDCEDKIAFNVGKDMFFSNFKGVRKVSCFCLKPREDMNASARIKRRSNFSQNVGLTDRRC